MIVNLSINSVFKFVMFFFDLLLDYFELTFNLIDAVMQSLIQILRQLVLQFDENLAYSA